MNKLFKKFGVLTLGVALVGGAAVALSAQKMAMGVDAAQVESKLLDFTTKSGSHGTYYQEWSYGDFKVFGGANNNGGWAFVKFGQKYHETNNPDGVTEAYVVSPQIADEISEIKYDVAVNSPQDGTVEVSLQVYSDADLGTLVESVNVGTINHKSAATLSITPAAGKPWGENRYYKINFVCTTESTNNGVFSVTKIHYYSEQQAQPLESISITAVPALYPAKTSQVVVNPNPASASLPTDLQYQSSNTDVFTVNASGLIIAVAPGTATLTVTSQATPTITANTTVTVQAYPFSGLTIGESYKMTCTSSGTTYYLSGMSLTTSTHYGLADSAPSEDYLLKVVNGIYGGTVAFETKDGYLKWSSGNSLDVDDEINANSSWIVNLSNDVYTVINFATFSTNSERYLKGNMGANPKRFACYTSGQTAISFEQVGADPDRAAAVAFAESFMTAIECHDNGATAPTYNTSWADLATAYEALSTNAKDLFINGHADKDSTDKIEQALALYDLLVSKYELTEFITGRVINSAIAPVSANNNNASFVAVIVVVSVIALASVATITTIVIVKRKFYR